MLPLLVEPLKPSHGFSSWSVHSSLKFSSYFSWFLTPSSSAQLFMNNRYAEVSISNIESNLVYSKIFYCPNSNVLLLMKSSKSVSSLSLAVDQMVLLPVFRSSVDDEKYLYSPIIIYDTSLSSLIVWWFDASGLAQIICEFSSPSYRVYKRYAYLSLISFVKDDEACISILMVTKKNLL